MLMRSEFLVGKSDSDYSSHSYRYGDAQNENVLPSDDVFVDDDFQDGANDGGKLNRVVE